MPDDLDTPSCPTPKDPASILEYFATLPDPRRAHGTVHKLEEIVFMAICAVLCGAESWQEIADYAESKVDWLATFLTLPGGVPSHDTFRRVFCLLDPAAFQECFFAWMAALREHQGLTPITRDRPPLRPVAIDGKTQRGCAARRRPIALAPGQRLVGEGSPELGPGGDQRAIERDHGHP